MTPPLPDFESDYVTVDMSKFPLVHVRMQPKEPSNEEMDAYIDYYDQLHLQPKPFVLLMEFPQKMVFLKAEHRIKLGNWSKNNKEKAKKCKACVFLVRNFFYNIIMKGVFLIQAPVNEYIVTDKMEKAEEWLSKTMENKELFVEKTNH